jgi:catechol 2,3-dioxygenase-like lactoylglutathione lyase family enzyme
MTHHVNIPELDRQINAKLQRQSSPFIWGRNVFLSALENKFKHPVHHFQIQVSNLKKSAIFYGQMLGRLSFTKVFETEGMVEWQNEGTRIIVAQSPKRFLDHGYHRKRIGLNHIAFRASSRAAVDDLYRNYLVPNKIPTLYGGPKEWEGYDPGYYAVYFEDPDRIKLELVYVPGDL